MPARNATLDTALSMARDARSHVIDMDAPSTTSSMDQTDASIKEVFGAFGVNWKDPLQARALFAGACIAESALEGAQVDSQHGTWLYVVLGLMADLVKE